MIVDWTLVSTVIVSLAGSSVLAGLIVAISTRKKVMAESEAKRADAAKKIEEAAGGLIEHYQRDNQLIRESYEDLKESMAQCILEIDELKKKLVIFEKRHAKLLDVIERLVHQVKSLNHTPVCGSDILDRIE